MPCAAPITLSIPSVPYTPTLFVQFRDDADDLYNPEAVVWSLISPTGDQTDYTSGSAPETTVEGLLYYFRPTFDRGDGGIWRVAVVGTTEGTQRSGEALIQVPLTQFE